MGKCQTTKCKTRKKRAAGEPYKKNGAKCGRGYGAKGGICYSKNITGKPGSK